jgi:ferritin
MVTASIDKLVELAVKEKDHSSFSFLQWFVDEQVEEEASVNNILDRFKYIGDKGMGLMLLNKELGMRK